MPKKVAKFDQSKIEELLQYCWNNSGNKTEGE